MPILADRRALALLVADPLRRIPGGVLAPLLARRKLERLEDLLMEEDARPGWEMLAELSPEEALALAVDALLSREASEVRAGARPKRLAFYVGEGER
jgi:hypothetical protein